jgi:hypothetical protein
MKEVKSYLERVKGIFDNQDEYGNEITKEIEQEYFFYSQSFKPELITKYFEGWDKLKGYYSTDNIDIFFYNRNFMIHNEETKIDDFLLFPRTLDRFICHCQDAGITLYSKEVSNERS